ncbi:MAG TPA: hypothetical protein VGP28_00075 [Methylocella sp.]|jgi:hypothetical protein|nr:hypothetical protein [Methylocella sp.]
MVAPQIGHSRPGGAFRDGVTADFSRNSPTARSNSATRFGSPTTAFQIGMSFRIFKMSDTEKGIIPKPHQLVVEPSGVTRWSPMFDSIVIEPLPQGGKRVRVTIKNDNEVYFDLTEEQITHLVALLVSSSSDGNASLSA